MLTNSQSPLNVAPANSSHDCGVVEPGIVPGRMLAAKSYSSPSSVKPRRKDWRARSGSSQSSTPPRGLTVMLSGLSRTSVDGDS